MTVAATSNTITYAGNGATTAFSFAFPAFQASDLVVTFADTNGVISTIFPSSYTVVLNPPVAPNPTAAGGVVNYPLAGAPIPPGTFLTITRILPTIQDTSLSNQGTLYPSVIEQAFDYGIMIDQQFQDIANRALTVAPPETHINSIPGANVRKGGILGFDNVGQPAIYAAATISSLTPNLVWASQFGVTFDGVTDDTPFWNAAIAFANARHDTTILCSNGVSKVTALNAFTSNGNWIVYLGGPGGCVINHSVTTAFTWSSGAKGGGMINVGLANRGANTNVTIQILDATLLQFIGLWLDSSIATLAKFGVTAGAASGLTVWHGCMSPNGLSTTSPAPLFDLLNGAGLFIRHCTFYCNGAPVAGRNFIRADIVGPPGVGTGSWSTLCVQDCFTQFFYDTLHANLTSNGLLIDMKFDNNYMGNSTNFGVWIVGTGAVTNSEFSDNWFDGNGTSVGIVNIACSFIFSVSIKGNLMGSSGGFGINLGSLTAGVIGCDVTDNRFFDINKTNTTVAGIAVAGHGAASIFKGIYVSGNEIEDNQTSFPGSVFPAYGVLITSSAGIANLRITDNAMRGQVANYLWPTPATGVITDNLDLASTTTAITVGASPFTYTASAQYETVYIRGGTVSDVKQNGVTIFAASPCTVELPPGGTMQVTYSSLPTLTTTKYG